MCSGVEDTIRHAVLEVTGNGLLPEISTKTSHFCASKKYGDGLTIFYVKSTTKYKD